MQAVPGCRMTTHASSRGLRTKSLRIPHLRYLRSVFLSKGVGPVRRCPTARRTVAFRRPGRPTAFLALTSCVMRTAKQIAHVHGRSAIAEAMQAKVLTMDEARRVVATSRGCPSCCATARATDGDDVTFGLSGVRDKCDAFSKRDTRWTGANSSRRGPH
jgi:hypothetical protein